MKEIGELLWLKILFKDLKIEWYGSMRCLHKGTKKMHDFREFVDRLIMKDIIYLLEWEY